jgi:hypothetical protein
VSDETNGPVAEAPAEGQEVEKVEAQAEQVESNAAPETEGEQETDKGQDDKPKRTGAQRAKVREQYLRNENSELQRRLDEALARQKSEPEAEAPPKEEDFKGDWFAYQSALNTHNVRKTIREENARVAQEQQQTRVQEARREIEIAHNERVAEAMDAESDAYIADYAEVMGKMKGVNISQDVAEAIVESDKSALLAYHLANHPEKLRELNALSGTRLARALGRLEGEVRRPAAKKQTTAPAPLSPVKGGASPAKSESDMAKSDDVSDLIKAWRSKKKVA